MFSIFFFYFLFDILSLVLASDIVEREKMSLGISYAGPIIGGEKTTVLRLFKKGSYSLRPIRPIIVYAGPRTQWTWEGQVNGRYFSETHVNEYDSRSITFTNDIWEDINFSIITLEVSTQSR
jgi:competence transcription factor ComK